VSTTHIGANETIVGNLRAGEDLSIAGRVQGRIDSEAGVIIEAGAIVEADIRAKELIVRGVLIGTSQVVDQVEITANGQVVGDIHTRRLQLRAGGRVQGEIATGMEVQPYAFDERAGGRSAGPGRHRVSNTATIARPGFSTSFSSSRPAGEAPSPAPVRRYSTTKPEGSTWGRDTDRVPAPQVAETVEIGDEPEVAHVDAGGASTTKPGAR